MTELQQVLESIASLRIDVDHKIDGLKADVNEKIDSLKADVDRSNEKIDSLKADVDRSNEKFEIYRQASQSVVNLAFGLIVSATVITVASSIFKR